MKKSMVLAAAAMASLLLNALPVAAHPHDGNFPPPYWVEDIYQGHEGWGFSRIVYAFGNDPMVDHFNYWYNGRAQHCIYDKHFNHDAHVNGGLCYHASYHHAWRHVSSAKHVRWCEAHYRSYRVASNTFVARSGVVKRCDSPYDGR